MKRIPLRLAGTALLSGTLILRAVRVLGNLESVRRFYPGGQGLVWSLLKLVWFFGPYCAAIAAIAVLWLRRDRAMNLGIVCLCTAAFFTLSEGLTLFARAMNANSGYVGAEPLCSAAVCAVSAAAVLRASRTKQRKP